MIEKETFWGESLYKNIGQLQEVHPTQTRMWTIIGSPGNPRMKIPLPTRTPMQHGPNQFLFLPTGSQAIKVVDVDETEYGTIPVGQAARVCLGADINGDPTWIVDLRNPAAYKDNVVNLNPAVNWKDTTLNNITLDHLWTFDQASGNALDQVGSVDLTLGGATATFQNEGRVVNLNGAVELKGSGDKFTSPTLTDFPDTFSISVWIKRIDATQPATIDWQRPAAGQILSWIPEATQYKIEIDGVLVSRSNLDAGLVDPSEWNHYVLTRNADLSWDQYVNARLIPRTVETNGVHGFDQNQLFVGNSKATSTAEVQIQQLAYFSSVLSYDAIRILWGMGRGKSYHA